VNIAIANEFADWRSASVVDVWEAIALPIVTACEYPAPGPGVGGHLQSA